MKPDVTPLNAESIAWGRRSKRKNPKIVTREFMVKNFLKPRVPETCPETACKSENRARQRWKQRWQSSRKRNNRGDLPTGFIARGDGRRTPIQTPNRVAAHLRYHKPARSGFELRDHVVFRQGTSKTTRRREEWRLQHSGARRACHQPQGSEGCKL